MRGPAVTAHSGGWSPSNTLISVFNPSSSCCRVRGGS